MDLVQKAAEFAERAHQNQKRKYTDEPYFVHPQQVARLVADVGASPETIAAAYLHDVVEDCGVLLSEIHVEFGQEVMLLVFWLTDDNNPRLGNRKKRKEISRERIRVAPNPAKTIKLADIISNTPSIVEHDPDFARVYLREIELLLPLLFDGNQYLYDMATHVFTQGMLRMIGRKRK